MHAAGERPAGRARRSLGLGPGGHREAALHAERAVGCGALDDRALERVRAGRQVDRGLVRLTDADVDHDALAINREVVLDVAEVEELDRGALRDREIIRSEAVAIEALAVVSGDLQERARRAAAGQAGE